MIDDKRKAALPERITFSAVWEAMMDLFNLEKGFFHTVWVLTVRPGVALREYIFEDRSKMSKPFGFLFFSVALSTIVTINFIFTDTVLEGISGGMQANEEARAFSMKLLKSFFEYYNLFMLVFVPVLSYFTYLIFKKPKLYLAEHFVINSFVFSWQMLFYILFTPLFSYDFMLANNIYGVGAILYGIYVYIRLFDYETFEGGARGLLVILISYTIYLILLMLLMLIGAIVMT